MIKEEKVDFLKSYKDKYYRCIYLENHLLGVKSISFQEIPGSKKNINDFLLEKQQIEKDLHHIEDIINNVEDARLQYILKYKFIHFKSLEEISEIMSYSVTQIKRLYKKALMMVPDDTV